MGIVANDTGRQRANKEWHHEYAEEALKKAWELYCDPHVDDSIGKKALTCDGMGDCYQVKGEFAAAMTSYEEALDIYSKIGADQDRDRVAKKLDELRGHADA